MDFVAENSNWVWKEKSEPSTCLYICVCVREHIFIGNVFTLGPTAQAALVYIKTKLNSKNKPEKPKKKQSVNWCRKYLQVFRHLPGGPVLWPLGTVVGNSLDRLSFAPRENLRTPATLLTGEKKQKFHC